MSELKWKATAEIIRNDLRLKTMPVAAWFLKDKGAIPPEAKRPSTLLKKKIALCQGVTMARNYGWTVGLASEDMNCVPCRLAFGMNTSPDPVESLARLFGDAQYVCRDVAAKEAGSISRFENGEIEAIVLSPLARATSEPDLAFFYGNPAQIMRAVQAWCYSTGERPYGHFGGKIECDEYLITPLKSQEARISIPGNGERIFAATQDDEVVFSLPGKFVDKLIMGLSDCGKAIGVRYPVPPFVNYQPDFPKSYKELGKEVGIE